MRPIKFRAWHKGCRIMVSWEDLQRSIKEKCHLKSVRYAVGQKQDDPIPYFTLFGNPFANDELILQQFTGLHDRNGKEIYEGDVVLEKHPEGDDLGQVMWVDGGFDLIGKDGVTALGPQVAWGNYEVIGNIYENPELLK